MVSWPGFLILLQIKQLDPLGFWLCLDPTGSPASLMWPVEFPTIPQPPSDCSVQPPGPGMTPGPSDCSQGQHLLYFCPNLISTKCVQSLWFSQKLVRFEQFLCVVGAKAAFTAHKWVRYCIIMMSKFWIPGSWSARKNTNCSYLNSILGLNVPNVTMDTKPALDQVPVKLI